MTGEQRHACQCVLNDVLTGQAEAQPCFEPIITQMRECLAHMHPFDPQSRLYAAEYYRLSEHALRLIASS